MPQPRPSQTDDTLVLKCGGVSGHSRVQRADPQHPADVSLCGRDGLNYGMLEIDSVSVPLLSSEFESMIAVQASP